MGYASNSSNTKALGAVLCHVSHIYHFPQLFLHFIHLSVLRMISLSSPWPWISSSTTLALQASECVVLHPLLHWPAMECHRSLANLRLHAINFSSGYSQRFKAECKS